MVPAFREALGDRIMSIAGLFFRTAVVLGLIGIVLGMGMGMSQDFRLAHLHAHLNLLGWVSFFLFGAFYHLVPSAGDGVLPKAHYTLSLIGLLVFMTGLYTIAINTDGGLPILAVVGSLLLLLGFLIFAGIVFRSRIARPA
jgi:cbb3-type cytochrome oxidase subunit 1